MLISFTVSNYKSILEPVTLNMVADEEDTSYADTLIKGSEGLINPVSVIYGPNGSGKSTVLDALKLLKALVIKNDIFSQYSSYRVFGSHYNRISGFDRPITFRVVFERNLLYVMNVSIKLDMISGTVDWYHDGTSETVLTINITSDTHELMIVEDKSKSREHYFNTIAFFKDLVI